MDIIIQNEVLAHHVRMHIDRPPISRFFEGADDAGASAQAPPLAALLITDDMEVACAHPSQPLLFLGTQERRLGESHLRAARDKVGANAPMAFVEMPLRAGCLIDKLQALVTRIRAHKTILIGPYRLSPESLEMVMIDDTKKAPLLLTEKERDILCFLGARPNMSIAHEMLLREIWAYKDGIDTHTLQTHIYRIRQKIEQDSSNPRLIVTDEDGYRYCPP
jgi:hypothetical protein